jgi:hypothetical protein
VYERDDATKAPSFTSIFQYALSSFTRVTAAPAIRVKCVALMRPLLHPIPSAPIGLRRWESNADARSAPKHKHQTPFLLQYHLAPPRDLGRHDR